MESRNIFLVLGLLAAGAAFADAYTWTDSGGVVHYSDRPNPGAKRIVLPEQRASRARPTVSGSADTEIADDSADPTAPFSYENLEIAKPGPEETLWNIEGVVDVSLSLSPALKQGHQVRVYFDGTPQVVGSTSFQLQEVWRGVHNLQVEIIDETGKLMIRTRPNRFYVQQNTVL